MRLKRIILLLSALLIWLLSVSNANAFVNKKFYVEKYGAVGDGKTNDIAAFQALARDVNANQGGVVVFPKGKVYNIAIEDDYSCGHKAVPDAGAIALAFWHCKKVVVDMNGCTIKMAPNHSTKYSFIFFFDCDSFSLSDGTLVGDVIGHDYSPVMYKGKEEKTSHQWGYGVYVRGSKGTIDAMDISRMTGDGIYFGSVKLKSATYHAKIEISGCEISYCRRNGISCASSLGFALSDSKIHHIGNWKQSADMPVAIEGCNPRAGIDFEYEGKAWDVGGVKISGCSFWDCTKKCIVTSNSSRPETTSFIIENCDFAGSLVHTNNLTSRGKKEIRNCRFNAVRAFFGDAKVYNCVFELGVGMSHVSKTEFYDCVFNGKLDGNKKGSFMAGTNLEKTLFERCKFKDIKGYNDNTAASQGFSGYVHPVNIVFVECEFENCSFVVSQKKFNSRLSFDGCTLRNGCRIHNLGTEAITFSNSELLDLDSYLTQNGKFIMDNCKIVQEDISVSHPFLSFGNHIMSSCTVIDKVGITDVASRKYGVKKYRIEAVNTEIQLDNPKRITKGLSLKGGRLLGVKVDDFQGKQEKTSFK